MACSTWTAGSPARSVQPSVSVSAFPPARTGRLSPAKPRAGRRPPSTVVSASSQASEAASSAAAATQSAAQSVVPGSVDAPIWAIALATLGVTVALGLSTFLFKPGFDASQEIQNRDRKSGRFK